MDGIIASAAGQAKEHPINSKEEHKMSSKEACGQPSSHNEPEIHIKQDVEKEAKRQIGPEADSNRAAS